MKILFVLVLFPLLSVNAQQLLVHYNFNQNLNDDSGNNLHCTKRTGTPTYVNGASEINGAVQLNGNADDVFLMPASSLLRPNYPFSVAVTFKADNLNAPGSTVFSSLLGTNTYLGANIQVHTNGALALTLGNGTQTNQNGRRTFWTPPAAISPNVWYTVVAIVRSDSDMELWINCEQFTSVIDYQCNGVTSTNQPYYSGCASIPAMVYGSSSFGGGIGEVDNEGSSYNATNTYWMEGAVDDMKFWAGEISENMIMQLNGVDAGIAQNGATLDATSPASQYQWINCSTNTPIAGETDQSFMPSSNGNYAVIVTNAGGCSDTSDCFSVANLDLQDMHTSGVTIYPNPTTGSFRIGMPEQMAWSELLISDVHGRLVIRRTLGNDAFVEVGFDYPSGVYFVTLIGIDGKQTTTRLIKDRE